MDVTERQRGADGVRRRQSEALLALTRRETLGGRALSEAVPDITETSARTLDVARVSVWVIEGEQLRCVDLFDRVGEGHSAGLVVPLDRYSGYLHALQSERCLLAADAPADPRLRVLADGYLRPNGIGARLDAAVRVGGRLVGVVCHEQVGAARTWTEEEADFAASVADLVALCWETGERRKAEAQLRESEERFRLLAENMSDLVCLHEEDGRFLWVSPSSRRLLGYAPGLLVGIDPAELVHPDDRLAVQELFRRPQAGAGREKRFTFRARRASGDFTWMETVLTPVEEEGKLRLQSSSREVQERIAVEQTLAQSEERYRTVVEHTVDGILLVDGEAMRVVDANPAYLQLLGYGLEELRQLPFEHLSPLPRERVVRGVQRLLSERRTHVDETQLRRRDGALVDVEVSTHAIEQNGRQVLCSVVRDISRRKQAESLERDRAVALELVAKNQPLETTLRHLTHMVERQRQGLRCTFLLESERRQGLPAAVSGGGRESFSTPIVSSAGEMYGILLGQCEQGRSPTSEDFSIFMMASKLAAIALDQRALTDRLAYQAQHDALTGLPNRRLFEDRLGQGLAAAERHKTGLALFFIDLDRFKQINDTLGHAFGDLLLRQVASRIQSVVRASDTVARMGGDEFTVILPDVVDPHAAVRVAQKLLDVLRQPLEIGGHELFVTASIGISTFPQDGQDAAVLQRNADIAMYRAKASGRNNFHCFTYELNEAAAERLSLEQNLRRALENRELELHFQPEVSAEGEVRGLEALLRWRHPRLGQVAPGKFIPIAEDCGLIVPIGTWALRRACEQYARWRKEGCAPVGLAVNVSSMQFAQADFVETVAQVLAETGVAPESLELELTESMLMRDFEQSREKLARLRALGLSIAVDDFGTGYSSLSYLHRLPIDTLKIDQSFVRELGEGDGGTQALVEAIVALARSLKLGVIAEGVENRTQLQALRRLGVDRIQGHLFFPALPESEVERLLGLAPSRAAG